MRVQLNGFEGPLDLLLDLARRQEVDLARISVLTLVDQYVLAVERLGLAATRLERAADWLVMAAWLTWLKSRLLLPKDSKEANDAERAAGVLIDRLAQMERLRTQVAWLEARPQLGRDTHARGAPERMATTCTLAAADISELLRACLVGLRRPLRQTYVPPRPILWRVPDAVTRLRSLLGSVPDGATLVRFLPRHLFAVPIPASLSGRTDLPLQRRGALASTLVGALELVREARLHLRQDEPFGPILVHPTPGSEDVASPETAPPAQAA
ncbi:MAG TPA: ScpA family protein [Acetobacteraceae bacterium]|nr:ScpA family protein [Acetobacteraceae bacterium]